MNCCGCAKLLNREFLSSKSVPHSLQNRINNSSNDFIHYMTKHTEEDFSNAGLGLLQRKDCSVDLYWVQKKLNFGFIISTQIWSLRTSRRYLKWFPGSCFDVLQLSRNLSKTDTGRWLLNDSFDSDLFSRSNMNVCLCAKISRTVFLKISSAPCTSQWNRHDKLHTSFDELRQLSLQKYLKKSKINRKCLFFIFIIKWIPN